MWVQREYLRGEYRRVKEKEGKLLRNAGTCTKLSDRLAGREMSETRVALVYLRDGTWVASQKILIALMRQRKLRAPPDLKGQADKGSDM